MTRETKDGYVVRDRRYWVDDDERDAEAQRETRAAAAAAAVALEEEQQRDETAADKERLRSALADLEETKHRVRRDSEKQLELQRGRVLEALLPVLDNLERTIQAGGQGTGAEAVVEGVKLVHSQFLGALREFGLERHSAVGERFDPRLHDAVAVVPVADPRQDGMVIGELEPAYHIGDRVIRPARVQVGRAAERATS